MPPAPDLVEQMYCSQQIHIPPSFPYILKQYAKAAIRTQPYDLLRWSSTYFRAMANAEEPPVKVRLEYPPVDVPSGLSPGYLKVLLKQFGGEEVVSTTLLYQRWQGVCLNENALCEMLKLGDFDEEVNVLQFIAIAAGHLTNTLSQTMIMICELLTEEPEGGSSTIPCSTFCDLYKYLAIMDCGPPSLEQQEEEYGGGEQLITKDNNEAEIIGADVLGELVDNIGKKTEETSGTDIVNELVDKVEKETIVTDVVNEVVDNSGEETIGEEVVAEVVDKVEEEAEETIGAEVVDNIGEETIGEEVVEEVTDNVEEGAIGTEVVDEVIANAEDAPEQNVGTEVMNDIITNVEKETDVEEQNADADQAPQENVDNQMERARGSNVEVPGIGPVIPDEQIDSVLGYMKYWAERQVGMVMPRNVRHFLCPPLDPVPLPEP